MAQLPGTIHIKRKLVEEPPETLYIEREGYGSGFDDHSARPVYRLVHATKRPRISHSSQSDTFAGQIPNVSVKSAPAIVINEPSQPIWSSSAPSEASEAQATVNASSKLKSQKSLQVRRIFHLATPKGSPLSRVSSTSSIRSMSRRRGRHGSSIAVFTERRATRVDQMARSIVNSRSESLGSTDDEVTSYPKLRKRPSSSLQRVQGAQESSSVLHDKEKNMDADLKLAAELHQFTLETLTDSSSTTQPIVKANEPLRKKPMKYQPRPPPPRQTPAIPNPITQSIQSPSVTEDVMVDDAPDEWVYDVYVRDVAQPLSRMEKQVDDPQITEKIQGMNVGVIIIRQEDEEVLEEFMSDDSGSDKWGEDDEDSNAEDHYGNDYPDELDSDDEWKAELGNDDEDDDEDDNYHLSDHE